VQFSFVQHIPDMQTDVLLGGLKQLHHLHLSQPDSFAIEEHPNLG
jgi:hypothetical protein